MIAVLEGTKMTITPQSEDVQSFERWSKSYETSLLQFLLFDPIHKHALNLVPKDFRPGSILDMGCGTGRLLREAAERWPEAHLFGADPSEGMISQARRLTPNANFQVSLAETLPLPEGSMDLVLSTASFHHWQDQQEGLRRVAATLRGGGLFVLADFVAPLGIWYLHPHGRRTDRHKLREMFYAAGLKIQSQHSRLFGYVLYTLGRKENS